MQECTTSKTELASRSEQGSELFFFEADQVFQGFSDKRDLTPALECRRFLGSGDEELGTDADGVGLEIIGETEPVKADPVTTGNFTQGVAAHDTVV